MPQRTKQRYGSEWILPALREKTTGERDRLVAGPGDPWMWSRVRTRESPFEGEAMGAAVRTRRRLIEAICREGTVLLMVDAAMRVWTSEQALGVRLGVRSHGSPESYCRRSFAMN